MLKKNSGTSSKTRMEALSRELVELHNQMKQYNHDLDKTVKFKKKLEISKLIKVCFNFIKIIVSLNRRDPKRAAIPLTRRDECLRMQMLYLAR